MDAELLQQVRDDEVLCEVPSAGVAAPVFYDGADASSSAFAYAAGRLRSLDRDDSAIAAAWAARFVRRSCGPDAVAAYDDAGAWTKGMGEAFSLGFVAFLRGSAWGRTWPEPAESWRTHVASTIAACKDGDGGPELLAALDDAILGVFGRLVRKAAADGALPFGAPNTIARGPYGEPNLRNLAASTTGSGSRQRKGSIVVGEQPKETSGADTATPMFSGIDGASPRRLGPALVVVAAGLVAASLCMWALYAFALRPGERDALTAARDTLEKVRAERYSDLYQQGSERLRREKWSDFAARLGELEHLGKLTTADVPTQVAVSRDTELGRTATVSYEASGTFGDARLAFRYVDVGFSGEWRLAELTVEQHPDVVDPPYPATDEGADALARRLLYAFQVKDFDRVSQILSSTEGRDRLESFRDKLLGDGHITLVERLSIDSQTISGVEVRVATYEIETNREHRSGTIVVYLTNENGSWLTRGVESKITYR